MARKLLGNDLIEASNRLDKRPELSDFGLDGQAESLDDCRIVGQTTRVEIWARR